MRKGNVNTEFKEFLRRAHQAISNGDADDVETAVFLFVSNVPPDDWRKFLRNRSKYCREEISWKANEKPTEQTLEKLGQVVHVLVLSAAIVARD